MSNFDRRLTTGCTVVTSTGKTGIYVGLVADSTGDGWNARVILPPPAPPCAVEYGRTEILHHRECPNCATFVLRKAPRANPDARLDLPFNVVHRATGKVVCHGRSRDNAEGLLRRVKDSAHPASFDPTTKHDGPARFCVECQSAS